MGLLLFAVEFDSINKGSNEFHDDVVDLLKGRVPFPKWINNIFKFFDPNFRIVPSICKFSNMILNDKTDR